MIRAKKPWAVASVAALLLALAFNYIFNYSVWSEVQPDYQQGELAWADVETKADSVDSTSKSYESSHQNKIAQLEFLTGIGEEVVGAADRRLLWLELLKAVNQTLPVTPGTEPGTYVDYQTLPLDERQELYIQYVESEYFPDMATWYTTSVQNKYFELQRHLAALKGADPGDIPAVAEGEQAEDAEAMGPSGPGWVVELKGYHFYNANIRTGGATHVRNTILRNLDEGSVELPVDNDGTTEIFTLRELGISMPILAADEGQPRKVVVPNPDAQGSAGAGGGGMMGGMGMGMDDMGGMMGGMGAAPPSGKKKPKDKKDDEDSVPVTFEVAKYDFTIQFCWQEQRLRDRLEAKRLAREEAAAAAAAAGELGTESASESNGLEATGEETMAEGEN